MIPLVRGNRETFLQSLQHLYGGLRGYTIWLYVDRARWHKGPPETTTNRWFEFVEDIWTTLQRTIPSLSRNKIRRLGNIILCVRIRTVIRTRNERIATPKSAMVQTKVVFRLQAHHLR